MDPVWGEPMTVASGIESRDKLGSVTDGNGGAYVWWLEGRSILLTHVSPNGMLADGWPANGRALGSLAVGTLLPQVLADGKGGVYVCWQGSAGSFQAYGKLVAHLGPDGQRTGGWSGTTLVLLELSDTNGVSFGVASALASDGGLWVAWARLLVDETGQVAVGGEYRATRILPDGKLARGWGMSGRSVGVWGASGYGYMSIVGFAMRPVAIADAGDGGCYVLRFGFTAEQDPGSVRPLVYRFASNGKVRLDWSTEGVPVAGSYAFRARAEESPQLVALAGGSVVAGSPYFGTEATEGFTIQTLSQDGESTRCHQGGGEEFHVEVGPNGAAAMSGSAPFGWHNWMIGGIAHVSGSLSSADGRNVMFSELQDDAYFVRWYGASSIALIGPESALLVWSQERGRFGVFANRLTLGQPVLDAGPGASTPPGSALRAAFIRGEGVRVRASFAAEGASRIALFDVAGRQVAGTAVPAGHTIGVVLPGTTGLATGLYFARVVHGDQVEATRVVVAR